jgi:hypothetical protein
MSIQLPVFSFCEGDTRPLLRAHIARTSGVSINFAAMTVRLRVAKDGGGYLEKQAQLTDAATGQFVFMWAPGDLLRGKHFGAVTFITEDGGILTTRNLLFDVRAPIE